MKKSSKPEVRFRVVDKETGNTTHQMRYEEYVRWMCLLEAIDLISEKAEKMDMNTETSKLWVKPLAFQKYIEERYPVLHYELQQDNDNLEEEGTESLFPTNKNFTNLR